MTPADTATRELPPGEEVAPADEEQVDPTAHLAEHYSPCRVCGSHWHEGPEGHTWVHPHCWRCGFRHNLPVGAGAAMGVTSPALSGEQVRDLFGDMRRGVVEDVLTALKGGQVPDVSLQPPGGGAAVPIVDPEALRAALREVLAEQQPPAPAGGQQGQPGDVGGQPPGEGA